MHEAAPRKIPDDGRCRVCGCEDTKPFYELQRVPVQDGLLWPTREEATSAPLGDIRLVFCPQCGYIFNRSFEPEKLQYRRGYDISLHHSALYREFIGELARRLEAEHHLRGKSVLEIACGNGDFLREICRRAGSRGAGFDPSLRPDEADTDGGNVTFVPDFYSERYADWPADLICCRHLLQSLPEPLPFLQQLRRTIGERSTPVYFEVPNARQMFHENVLWYITYEYCSFFTEPSLRWLFERAGFETLSASPCFRDNYLGIDARVGPRRSDPVEHRRQIDALAADVEAFRRQSDKLIRDWDDRMDALKRSGRRAAVWGAGGRAITFFNLVRNSDAVQDVVDINPKRQDLFLPKTGQRVLAPDALRQSRPEVVLVSNPTFLEEIRGQVESLGLRCEFLVL